ncbi:arpA protein [Spirillospora sp. NPDC047279]|uniref:HalD/BesD family halogenase n=1 Tax=Spirillospora sp. NPDC047279 TaxID=3155478 RepID=UPI0033CE537E
MSTSVERVVNTTLYRLGEPACRRELVARVRGELRETGCSVLPDFISPDVRDTLRRECAAVAPQAHYDVETVNVYNLDVGAELPEGHPGRVTFERGNAFVARDRIPVDAVIQRLYSSRLFQGFVADCFGLPQVFELADPLSALCLNVVRPGMEHPWHFDINEFTISMLTQEPETGGVFEYCPGIRSAGDENFAEVARVLAGNGGPLVRRLELRPGDLQLFQGRYSLHRVSEVEGTASRHSAIFAYSERPGVIGSVARTRQLFGRVLPAHLEAENVRVDQLLD